MFKWKISRKDCQRLYKYLDLDAEICGVCVPPTAGPYLQLSDRDQGPTIREGERGSCRSTNRWINYHTHPRLSKPWPSVEDVFNVLYERPPAENLWRSLIFTEWGIWEIYSPRCYDPDWLDEQLEWWKQHVSYRLYWDLFPHPKSPVPPYAQARPAIEEFARSWRQKFGPQGLEIVLTPWSEIKNGYTLVSSLCKICRTCRRPQKYLPTKLHAG
jgi:hypothetical protein